MSLMIFAVICKLRKWQLLALDLLQTMAILCVVDCRPHSFCGKQLLLLVGNWFKQRRRICHCSWSVQTIHWRCGSHRYLFRFVFDFRVSIYGSVHCLMKDLFSLLMLAINQRFIPMRIITRDKSVNIIWTLLSMMYCTLKTNSSLSNEKHFSLRHK